MKPSNTDLEHGFEVSSYLGTDGIPVLEIDTPEMDEDENGPKCRIYLNDGEIYINPSRDWIDK